MKLFYIASKDDPEFNSLLRDIAITRVRYISGCFTITPKVHSETGEPLGVVLEGRRKNFKQPYKHITRQTLDELTLIPETARWAYLVNMVGGL